MNYPRTKSIEVATRIIASVLFSNPVFVNFPNP